jgi:ankyrin repeat protein
MFRLTLLLLIVAISARSQDLVQAIGNHDCARVVALLKGKSDPNSFALSADAKTNHFRTPVLQLAILNDDSCAATALVRAGADPDLADSQGGTPLVTAIANSNPKLVTMLLYAGADPRKRTAANPTQKGGSALDAARAAVWPLIVLQVQSALDATTNKETPDQNGNSAAVAAAILPDAKSGEDIRDFQAKMGAAAGEIDRIRMSFFREAVKGDVGEIRSWINNKMDIDWHAPSGITALFAATYFGNEEVVKLLLAAGADRNFTTPWGTNLVQTAEAGGHAGVINLMRATFEGSVTVGSNGTIRDHQDVKARAKSFEDNWLAAHPESDLPKAPFIAIKDDPEYKRLEEDIRDQIQLDLMPTAIQHAFIPFGESSLKLFEKFSSQMAAWGCGPRDHCYGAAGVTIFHSGGGGVFGELMQYERIRANHEFRTGISAPSAEEVAQTAMRLRKHEQPTQKNKKK